MLVHVRWENDETDRYIEFSVFVETEDEKHVRIRSAEEHNMLMYPEWRMTFCQKVDQ